MPGYLVTGELFVPCYCGATDGALSATDWWEPGVGAKPAAPVEDAPGKANTCIGCGICIDPHFCRGLACPDCWIRGNFRICIDHGLHAGFL